MEMRFLADMCVDVRVIEWLREQGHDAIHLRDEGLHRMPNGEIFEKGIKEDRVILTFDLDFAEIAALTGGEKTSVVLFRLKNTRAPNVINHLSKSFRIQWVILKKVPLSLWRNSDTEFDIFPLGKQEIIHKMEPLHKGEAF